LLSRPASCRGKWLLKVRVEQREGKPGTRKRRFRPTNREPTSARPRFKPSETLGACGTVQPPHQLKLIQRICGYRLKLRLTRYFVEPQSLARCFGTLMIALDPTRFSPRSVTFAHSL
jgi:hypothetical protein